jgi:hypothetical protein
VCDSSAVGGATDEEQGHIIDLHDRAIEEAPGYECEGSLVSMWCLALFAVKAAF